MRVDLLIKTVMKDAVKSLYGLELTEVSIEHPLNRSWGDYSSNVAMVTAKSLGKTPVVMAQEVVVWLKNKELGDFVEKIEVAGPGFINFTLSNSFYLNQMLLAVKEADNFGRNDSGKGKRIALEHSNVNPNKAAHIGHLRNAILGQFLERIYEFMGYDVNVQYYCNDLGVQVSTSLLGMERLPDLVEVRNYRKFDHYAWDVYSRISQLIDTDDALKKELDELMLKLEARDPEVSSKQKKLADKVLCDNLTTFSQLDVDYDLVVYESSIKDAQMWEKAFELLKTNPHVYLQTVGPSAGCWLVRMNDTKVSDAVEEDKIIVRSNGIPTYTGKDIAYHMWKFGLLEGDFRYKGLDCAKQGKPLYETSVLGDARSDFKGCDIVLDVIDVRQTYAIDAVRKSLLYLGYSKQHDNLIHVNYGHVYLSGSTARKLGYIDNENDRQIAMSGRKGVGVKIDDFIEMVDKNLHEHFGDFPNHIDVRNSAIRYDMLRYDTYQDIVFDIDSSLNTKGFNGTYIQYSHARATTLIEKAHYVPNFEDNKLPPFAGFDRTLDISALEILRTLYKFPEVVSESAERYAPNILCLFLFELCQNFNTFYNDSPILSEEDSEVRNFRILLTASVKQVVKNGLYLLGIRAVDKM